MADASQPAPGPASAGADVRIVMLGWCLWLLGSWAVTLTLDSPVPAVRWMVFATFFGLTVAWPLVRLSQDVRSAAAAGTIFLDWFCLILIFQAVVWPLSLVGQWSWRQAAWLDAAIASWSLLIGAIVALGCRFRSSPARVAAMAVCLLLVLGAPAVRALAGRTIASTSAQPADTGWTQGLQPLAVLWELTQRSFDVHFATVAGPVVAAAVAAAAAWIGVLATGRLRRSAGPEA